MKKILIIEDEEVIRDIVSEILEEEGFDVIQAGNGLQGVDLAQVHHPDLIICDVMMPELDGYGVLVNLRSQPEFTTTPFIFLTAKVDKMNIRQGMASGADDYLTKPFTRSELMSTIIARLDKQTTIRHHYQQKLDHLRGNISLSLPHELLTPLNGLIGLSDYLIEAHESVTPAEVLEVAQHLNRSARRLERVVQNTLLYAQLHLAIHQSQTLSSEAAIDHLCELITQVARRLTQTYNRLEDLKLDLHNAPLSVRHDHLQKILEEVLDNACKFSPVGTPIQVSCQLVDQHVVIQVINQGHGLTAAQIEDIGAYMQFDRRLYEQQGSGLGLVIVRQLANLYGGTLDIVSQQDQETQITLTLPSNAAVVDWFPASMG